VSSQFHSSSSAVLQLNCPSKTRVKKTNSAGGSRKSTTCQTEEARTFKSKSGKFNLSGTAKVRKGRHKARTSRTFRTWSKVRRNSLLSGNRLAKSSPNKIQDSCGITFSYPSIVSLQTSIMAEPIHNSKPVTSSQSEILSQERRYPDNSSPTSPSCANDNCDDSS
jgi:hypothetical protein